MLFYSLLSFGSFWYGLSAILALFHDVILVLGAFSILGKIFQIELNLPFFSALLLIVGYSINDTIVIFDRIRENLTLLRKETLDKIINSSINQTLSRTAITSLSTELVLIVIFSALSPVSSAVVPITRKSKTLTILISVLSPSFAKEGETVFKFYPDITAFASKFAEFLSLRSVTKAGLLIYNVEPGERFIEKFSELFKGEIVGIERFNREDSEFKTQLLKLKAKSPEAIVFIGYPINDIYFLSQLVEMDFKPLVLLQLANYPPVNKGAKEALKILRERHA